MPATLAAPTDKNKLYIKNAVIVCIAVAVMMFIHYLPTPEPFYNGKDAIPLTPAGKTVMACMCFAVILWMTEAIPFSVTGLLLIVLMFFFKIDGYNKLVALGWGNNVLMFVLGAMGLSGAMTASGIAKRVMLMMIVKVGRSTDKIILAFIVLGTLISMWVTDLAVAAMLTPLGVGILRNSGCKPLESNFGRALMIGIVWGALIGGTATPAGCGPNVLAMQFVRDIAGLEVSFIQWMIVGVPGAALMVPLGWFILLKVFPPEFKEIPMTLDGLKDELNALGGLNEKEIKTIIVFVLMVTLWLTGDNLKPLIGFNLSESFVGLFGFLLLFIPGLRVFETWREASDLIDWASLVLMAGGISAGLMLSSTGAARWLAWAMLSDVAGFHPIVRVLAVVTVVEVMKIFFSSNSVTGAVVMPLIIALALELGMNPWLLAGPAGIASSMAFIMVTSSVTNLVPYSSGYFTIPDFAKVGVLMTIVAICSVTFAVAVFGPFANMNIW